MRKISPMSNSKVYHIYYAGCETRVEFKNSFVRLVTSVGAQGCGIRPRKMIDCVTKAERFSLF